MLEVPMRAVSWVYATALANPLLAVLLVGLFFVLRQVGRTIRSTFRPKGRRA
jgi:hypothetical protein